MKIRSGFVSNSSSSSFILGIKKDAKNIECPCCHRKGLNIIEYIEKIERHYSSDETEIIYDSRESLLRKYRGELDEKMGEISDLKKHDLNAPSRYPYRNGEKVPTYGDLLKWAEEDCKNTSEIIDLIAAVPSEYELIKLQVSYHDDTTHQILDNEQKAGNIITVIDFDRR